MPADAARLNRQQIREQEQLNRSRKLQAEVEEQRRQQSYKQTKAQFDYVPSTLGGVGGAGTRRPKESSVSACSDDALVRVFIRECDGEAAQHFAYQESEMLADDATSPKCIRKPGGPLPPPRGAPRTRGAAGSPLTPPAPSYSLAQVSAPERSAGMPNLGRVPKYLQQRKAELAEEKRAIAMDEERRQEMAKVPRGHRLVPEEEKAAMLIHLNEREEELEQQLRKIPVRFDTQNVRQKRRAIEEEMEKIEQSRAKYSTKRPLYVPLAM